MAELDKISLLQRIAAAANKAPTDPVPFEDWLIVCKDLMKDGEWVRALDWGKRLMSQLPYGLRNGATMGDKHRFYSTMKQTLKMMAPYDLDSYLLFVEWERDDDKKFYAPRRNILRPTVRDIQALMDDQLDILSISMPPGTGKSTLEIFTLSWVMGRNPEKPNLVSAHSSFLTTSIYQGVQQILNDEEYLWKQAFPGHFLAATNSQQSTLDIDKKHRFSTLTCRAIDGSLTGATRCEGLLCADDLVSGIEEAMSKDRLDKLWHKYTNDLKSRKKLGAKELHIATRWSVHDVIGRLAVQYEGDPRAKFTVMPALNEQDESNFNYKHSVGFDTRYFRDMRDSLDDASFKALFQNEPIEREGLLYNADELRRYYSLPEREPDAILSICDTKDKGKDYLFMPVIYQYGQDYYFHDCVYDNSSDVKALDEACAQKLTEHKVQMCQFESNSAGGRTADAVNTRVKELGGRTHITKKYTTQNKETKIYVNSGWVKEHVLFRDPDAADVGYKPSSPYGKAVANLTSYTTAGRNPTDDVPDGLAMFALFAQNGVDARTEVMRRPF